jgi:thiosulfate/3-mercaptopyruvate sulfurtransferase
MGPTPSRPEMLVDTAWLFDHLGENRLVVVDIRGSIKPPAAPKPQYAAKRDAYLEAHVPGAVFVDWT